MSAGRPHRGLGQAGKEWLTALPNGKWRAGAWVRDSDGRSRQVTATAPTKGAARRALERKIASTQQTRSSEIQQAWTVERLARHWLAHKTRFGQKRSKAPMAPQSVAYYHSMIDRAVIPHLGNLRLHEITPARLEDALFDMEEIGVATDGPRTVLSQMLDLALRDGAISNNPMRHISIAPRAPGEVYALSIEDARDVLFRVHPDTRRKPGKRGPSMVLHDFVTFALGTGCRIGEILAVTWGSLDLDAEVPTVRIDGTLVEPRKAPKGLEPLAKATSSPPDAACVERRVYVDKLHRQEHTKTHEVRVLALNDAVVDMLRRRRSEAPSLDADAPVFATRTCNWVWPANMRDDLRTVLAGSLHEDATPHTFRRTVGTHLAYEAGVDAAKLQLGHTITGSATIARYVAAREVRPDHRHLLQAFFSGDLS